MRAAFVALALLALCACRDQPTALRSSDISAERSLWRSHNLTRYAYVFETTGFLIAYGGRPIRLVIINDSVASAQDVETDSILASTAGFPTLDQLFDDAETALAAGTLTAITFDSTFGFPARMDLAGPPDASGSILASGLELLP